MVFALIAMKLIEPGQVAARERLREGRFRQLAKFLEFAGQVAKNVRINPAAVLHGLTLDVSQKQLKIGFRDIPAALDAPAGWFSHVKRHGRDSLPLERAQRQPVVNLCPLLVAWPINQSHGSRSLHFKT